MLPARSRFSPAFLVALLILAAGGHALVSLLAMREKSTASDELVHVTGGFTFNHWNDYRLHPENGLLPQRWQALPATLAGAYYPALASQDWRDGNAWMIGHRFFYRLGNNTEWMLFTARHERALRCGHGAADRRLGALPVWLARRLHRDLLCCTLPDDAGAQRPRHV